MSVDAGSCCARLWWTLVPSPLGPLYVARSDAGVTRISLPGNTPEAWLARAGHDPERFADEHDRLVAWLIGETVDLELDLHAHAEPFALDVWAAVREIPYGVHRRARELAADLGRPDMTYAVTRALDRNPHLLATPCHRVTSAGTRGWLAPATVGAYPGGHDAKAWLLDHESRVAA